NVAKKQATLAGSAGCRVEEKIFESSAASSTSFRTGSQGCRRIFASKPGIVKEALQITAKSWRGIGTELVTTSSFKVFAPETCESVICERASRVIINRLARRLMRISLKTGSGTT